ncbi:proline-rich family protein [Pseudohyphozyma bogoriensis]|nr:proline-rich family protein [Pseudohyphozyma bogoriensis]
MAKKANPVDAHRKAQRKKEIKKNKEDRKKAKEVATVKKDTRSLESDIRSLADAAQKGPLSASDKAELASLRAELARINKAKNEYVEAHPEHRKFVFPDRKEASTSSADSGGGGNGLYDKNGRLRHPERSVYYDPVFNPFGAPPPGMPYREKPPTPEEMAAFQAALQANFPEPTAESDESDDSSDDDEDDDDIAMPAGLDDIPMPSGPPPPRKHELPARPPPMIARPSSGGAIPSGPRAMQQQQHHQPFHPDPHMRHGPQRHQLPQRPMQYIAADPLANDLPPKPTYQAYHSGMVQHEVPLPPGAAPPPPPPPPGSSASTSAAASPFLPFPNAIASSSSASISAAPQLRDLKAEATAFVPTAMRRKKPAASASSVPKINAAPGGAAPTAGGERANLMSALSGVGIGAVPPGPPEKKKDGGKEDYERFQREMKGFL